MAFARVIGRKKLNDWSCGRAGDPLLAYARAASEAQEWAACGRPDGLVQAQIQELEHVVDPREIICYHPSQYRMKKFPFKPFSPRIKYSWKKGLDAITGEKVFVLADCIYFPYYSPAPQYTYANSSGAAAYPTRQGAVERAVLELVERDAFMITWLNRLLMPRISSSSLPDNIRRRIRVLESVGFAVVIKDLTLDLAPVVLVFAQNPDLPLTTCAACSSLELTEALDHALMEVEATVFCSFNTATLKPLPPSRVRYTYDHGNLYEQQRFFRRADFLGKGGKFIRFRDIGADAPKTWKGLVSRLLNQGRTLIAIDLSPQRCGVSGEDLHIVKMFVPGTVPISFGYQQEPCGMQRIYSLPVRMGYRSSELRYGELNRFPHPYT